MQFNADRTEPRRGRGGAPVAVAGIGGGVIRVAGEAPVADPLGVGGGAKNLATVAAQRLQPRVDVAGVVGDVGGDAELGGDEHAGQLRPKFLCRVVAAAEAGIAHRAVQPRGVGGAMAKLVQGRRRAAFLEVAVTPGPSPCIGDARASSN